MARCRSVPALVALTPSTAASSALESSAWYLSAITSRSRGGERGERGADGVALARRARPPRRGRARRAARASRRSAARLRRRSSSSAALRTMPNSHARGDPAAGVEARAPLVGALERLGGDVLGGRAVAQERRGVGEDVVPRLAVERVEVERARRGGGEGRGGGRHTLTTIVCGIHHRSALDSFAPMRRRAVVALLVLALFPAAAAAKEPQPWATVNVCDTAKQPDAIGIRASMPGHTEGRAAVDALPGPVPRRPTASGSTSRTPTPAGARSAPRRARRSSPAGASRSRSRPRPVDAARRRALPLAPRRHAAAPARGRPPRPATAPAPAPTRRATPPPPACWQLSEQPRVVGDDAGDAEPLEPADARRLVDGPHVELAAGLAHGAHEPRRDEPPVGHQRVAAAGGHVGARRARAASRAGRRRRRRPGSLVSQAVVGSFLSRGTRPAEPQRRLQRADRTSERIQHRGDERALDQPVLAQRVDDALLVARELEVDVELDAVERAGREVGEALLERRRAVDVPVVVREQQRPASGASGARAARRTRSCPRRAAAPRRTTRACCRGR